MQGRASQKILICDVTFIGNTNITVIYPNRPVNNGTFIIANYIVLELQQLPVLNI